MTIESRLENMQDQLTNLIELLQISISSLNTKKSVSKFLNKSEKTIDNYIKNDTFIENKHYFYNENKRVEFIPFAIVEFKKNPTHKIKLIINDNTAADKLELSETTSKILKGLL